MRITRLETFLVKPRWLFLKIHTDEGLVGLGEPIVEGRALTVAQAVAELEPYLIGKDPTSVVHHWQAMYKHAFYRGGPVLTSAISGVDQALWDLAGKAVNLPVYKLLGGPRRARIIETPGFVGRVVDRFAAIREAAGPEVDIAIDFHGAISPQTAGVLIK